MNSSETVIRSTGLIGNDRMVCQFTGMTTSKGIFFGDSLLTYSLPALFLQFALIVVIDRCVYLLIRPLRQSMITAQILAGIILGPSLLARNGELARLFTPEAKLVLETFVNLGFILYAFILGLQFDTNSLKMIGRMHVTIGVCSTIVPLVAGTLVYRIILRTTTVIDSGLVFGLYFMVAINSMSSFVVTTSFLTDLNILNSEVGRLATSAALISDLCGWFMGAFVSNILAAIIYSLKAPLISILMMFAYYAFIFLGVRPLVIKLVCYGPEGSAKPAIQISDSHFLALLIIVLGLAYVADIIGQHWAFASFIFGVCLPAQPPLNSEVVQKLRTLVSGLLIPVYCTNGGLRTDIWSIGTRSSLFIELVIVIGYISKFTGTILPALYFDLPLKEALCLAFIMCSKGIIEIASYCLWMDTKVINNQTFALLIVSMIFVIGVSSPIVSYLYDPSKRYTKNTSTSDQKGITSDLRLLVCIHGEENVPTIINLIETFNPTKASPITVFVVQLKEINGLSASILAPVNLRSNNPAASLTSAERIVNAFRYFEHHSRGPIVVQHYTSITPYASMHNDICNLALDKRTNIVIVPYHKHWAIDGTVEATFPSIRAVNQNVILKAPCSVGVLIDRGHIGSSQSVLAGPSWYRLAMLYIGGDDDQEALDYSRRMAGHPNVSLTVVWLKATDTLGKEEKQSSADIELMQEFQQSTSMGKEKIVYKEEKVNDGIGTAHLIRSMEEAFDLIIVGRRHNLESPVTLGLSEWSECPELGVIGDMLATSEYQVSVLVLQQSH